MNSSVKSFGCHVCPKAFRSPKALTDHIRTFHGSGMISIMDLKNQPDLKSAIKETQKKVANKCSLNRSKTKDTNEGHGRKYGDQQNEPNVDVAKIRAETETLKKYSEAKDPAEG